jgi:hypothetical protein
MSTFNNQSITVTNSKGNSSGKGSSPLKVDLSSDVDTLSFNSKAILTFSFSDTPIDFGLDDIKVTNGTVTNLVQSKTNPFIYTADFMGALNATSNMSTIKLDGAYADAAGISGTPSNTVTIKNVGTAITPTVGFTSSYTSIAEGNSGTTPFSFTLKLSASSADAVTVNYSTEQMHGSATVNADYIPVTGSVVFAPGETSKTISVNVIGDQTYEADECFYVNP